MKFPIFKRSIGNFSYPQFLHFTFKKQIRMDNKAEKKRFSDELTKNTNKNFKSLAFYQLTFSYIHHLTTPGAFYLDQNELSLGQKKSYTFQGYPKK